MSVNSHRHVQFPRGQHSKSSFHSGGYAAKETSYVAKVEKVSPESGGFAAGALSYYYDDEMRSERETYQYYQEQVRDGNYRRVQIQSRTQQNSLYELEYSPKGRPSDYYHPRTDYFREKYHQPECQSPSKKFSFHSTDRSPHRSFSRMDYSHNRSPVNSNYPPSDALTRKNHCIWEGKVVQKATTSTNKGEKELQELLPDKFLPEDMGLLTKGLKGKGLVQGEIGSTTGQIKGEYIH